MTESQAPRKSPITTTVESPESWKRVVKIEVDRELYEKEYAQRLKKAAKSHQKPGFRKGRTPRALVERELGELLRMEAIEEIIQQAWTISLLENRLRPITGPALENFKFEDEGPMSFDMEVEVRPEVKADLYEGLPVKKRELEVKDSDVQETLESMQEHHATFEVVERAAVDGDQVTLDLTFEVGDGRSDGPKVVADQQLIVGDEHNIEAFNEGLLGVSADEEKEISVVFPDEHPDEALKGQSVVFMCKVKEVAEKKLPELDDELAGKVIEGRTLEELRADIRDDLAKEMDKRVKQEMDHQVLKSLVKRNPVDLPPSMVDSYMKRGLEELHRHNLQTGRPINEAEDAKYLEGGKSRAELALRGILLLESIREQEEIKVTDEDVDERIKEIAAEHGYQVDQYKEFVNSVDERDKMTFDLLERRTYDFLLSRAEIEMVSADTKVLAEEEE